MIYRSVPQRYLYYCTVTFRASLASYLKFDVRKLHWFHTIPENFSHRTCTLLSDTVIAMGR
jgi:hypothetical protein